MRCLLPVIGFLEGQGEVQDAGANCVEDALGRAHRDRPPGIHEDHPFVHRMIVLNEGNNVSGPLPMKAGRLGLSALCEDRKSAHGFSKDVLVRDVAKILGEEQGGYGDVSKLTSECSHELALRLHGEP